MIEEKSAPNEEFLELTCVKDSATGVGLNDKITMRNLGDGTFSVTSGRVGIKLGLHKEKTYVKPMEKWHEFYVWKINAGYLLTKQKEIKREPVKKTNPSLDSIKEEKVRELVKSLIAWADIEMKMTYTVTVENISDEMIDYAGNLLKELEEKVKAEKISVADFNMKLQRLFAAVPRRIYKVGDLLAKSKEDFVNILEAELETYNFMVSQVKGCNMLETSESILARYGLKIREATKEEKEEIAKRIKSSLKLVNAYKVTNIKTEKIFNDYVEKNGVTVKQLFHGSKHRNWWSILTNGLWCEPEKHPEFMGGITGKAGGLGAYFAPDAIKSMGYTSFMGSKWANGSEATGFMALFKVATGNEYYGQHGYNSNFTWDRLQQTEPGSHCLWLKTRYSGFMMDEVIVYQEQQFTIDYLLEVKR